MDQDLKQVFSLVNEMIYKKKQSLLNRLPAIIEYGNDLISIRTYDDWVGENGVMYKLINNLENPDDRTYFVYLKKDSIFTVENNKCVSHVTCLTGKIKLVGDNVKLLDVYEKMSLTDKTFNCHAIENSFIIASMH